MYAGSVRSDMGYLSRPRISVVASARFSSKRLACFFRKVANACFYWNCLFCSGLLHLTVPLCVCNYFECHSCHSKKMPCMFSCISHFMHICQSCMFCTHNCVGLCMFMHGTVGGDWLRLLFCAVKTMAHFEQASLLATAWANDDEVKTMALQHSIIQVSNNKKLRRSRGPSWFSCMQI